MLRLILKAERPAIMAVLLGKIDSTVVPRVAIAAIARLHGHERCTRGIRRGVLEKRASAGGRRLILATVEEGGDGRDAARFADFAK